MEHIEVLFLYAVNQLRKSQLFAYICSFQVSLLTLTKFTSLLIIIVLDFKLGLLKRQTHINDIARGSTNTILRWKPGLQKLMECLKDGNPMYLSFVLFQECLYIKGTLPLSGGDNVKHLLQFTLLHLYRLSSRVSSYCM